jgi:hypothetical protein
MGVMPLVTQLMRSGDCSVIVIDLKADDHVLFECVREEANRLTEKMQRKQGDRPSYPFASRRTILLRVQSADAAWGKFSCRRFAR